MTWIVVGVGVGVVGVGWVVVVVVLQSLESEGLHAPLVVLFAAHLEET